MISAEDVDCQRHVVAQDARIIRRCFDTGGRIDLAAYVFNVGCNFPGGTIFSSLESHVFKKMGYTVLVAGLIPSTLP